MTKALRNVGFRHAVVQRTPELMQHGLGRDVAQIAARLAHHGLQSTPIERTPRTVGERHFELREGRQRRIVLALLGPLLAIEHVGPRRLMFAGPHQREFDLILNVFDVNRGGLRAALQRIDDLPRQTLDRIANAGRLLRRAPFDGEKRLGHGHGDLRGVERREPAVTTNHAQGRVVERRIKFGRSAVRAEP
ncbi:MAG: hypothetical protein QM775_03970 [Pirellulales bacterium]